MAKIHDMMQERATLTASIREMMNQGDERKLTGEERASLSKMEADFDALNGKIISEEKQLERERAAGEVADQQEQKPQSRTRELFSAALTGNGNRIQEYRNSMTLGDDAQAGSLTAPMDFIEQLIKGLDDFLFMRRISHITPRIGAAQSLGYPYRATEATDAEWVGEVAEPPKEEQVSYGRREFVPKRMTKEIVLSKTLVSHSNMAERVVREEMMYRIAITQEKAYMLGDGVGKPLGIFVASNDGIPTSRDITEGNTATAVTFDGLINAKYALKQQYMVGCQWIMHRDLVKQLAKIKDANQQYIWQPSVALGVPDMLLSMPVNMSEYAPNTYTTGKYAAILGNFKNYWICDADTLTIQVLNELYARTNQVGYLYNYFGDGAPVLGEAFARVKMGA